MKYALFVSCPKGLEYLLEAELQELGLQVTKVSPQGVYGDAHLAVIYQLVLWSRLANRIQLILFSGHAHNEQAMYQLCHQFPWQTIFTADKSIAIEFHGTSEKIRNSMYGAQVVKDAIADHFRQLQGMRPTVNRESPQILLHAHLKQSILTVSLDLVGYSLHQRGYRRKGGGAAPLKENVAAALLLRAEWPKLAAEGYALYDPFCGSGTLVIEAAMMAAKIAPGLLRDDHSLPHWTAHQPSLWEKMRMQALKQVIPFNKPLWGSDNDSRQVHLAKENAERAGVSRLVEFKTIELSACQAQAEKGLLICNPPYGARLGETTHLFPLYQQLGKMATEHFAGWQLAFLTSDPMLAKATGLHAHKQYTIYNGPIECKLYKVNLQTQRHPVERQSAGAQMFANRLKKNVVHLKKWAQKNQISCYRVYDADLPEYAFAIDIYNDYAVLQEYAAPANIATQKVERRSLEVIQVTPGVLGISPDHLIIKQRQRQKGSKQYQKLAKTQQTLVVHEGQAQLKVNLSDYLDTGLFLDHRLLRLRFAHLPKQTRFLNCFCYTATASVHAALAGAITTNVDLSNTYLKWAEENFKLNQLDCKKHQFIQQDCLKWLTICRDRFDVIFLDPPSFSNSKRMTSTLDIQRDHSLLIQAAMRLLKKEGMLYFSTNRKGFKLSDTLKEQFNVKDITHETIDVDFARHATIHQCYLFKKAI